MNKFGIALILALLPSLVLATPVRRTAQGDIYRSQTMVRKFRLATVCPATQAKTLHCPGFIVDHIGALACAKTEEQRLLLDQPWNMQYQSKQESDAKDRGERSAAACRRTLTSLQGRT